MQMHLRRVVAIVVIVVVMAIALVSLGLGGTEAKEVEVETPAVRDIRPSIFASGQIVHGFDVRLTSEVVGRVKAVHVVEGQVVERGDLVLAIDDEAYAAQVEQNRAAVRLQEIDIERKTLAIDDLQRQVERSRPLFERDLLEERTFETMTHRLRVAGIDLDSSRELLAQARATLAQSEEQLEKTRVRAPNAGVVASLDIEEGETAIASSTNIPGSALMVIADPQSIVTEVYVDEADVSDIRLGQAAQVVAIAYPEQPLTGIVEFIANTAKHQSNRRGLSFRVRIRIAARDGVQLKSGMSCRSEIFTAAEGEALSVSIRALVNEDDPATRAVRHFVYVVETGDADAGVVRKTAVEVGRGDDEFQEVRAGVEAGTRIVVGPGRTIRHLRDGDAVKIAGG